MRIMACRSLLVLGLATGAAACDGRTVVEPGPTGPPPGPLSTVRIRVEGRVTDFDNDGPVAGAVIKLVGIIPSRAIDEPAGTSDEHGGFGITADVPADWRELTLSANRDGYQTGRGWVGRSSLSVAHLSMYRDLTIRAGQSIDIRAGAELDNCFDDGFPCRRVVVEAPSGESIDLAVSTTDSAATVGLDGRAETHTFAPPRWLRQLTVSGGEVWVYGVTPELGLPLHCRVTLTATRR
jgi:hypothetical protein